MRAYFYSAVAAVLASGCAAKDEQPSVVLASAPTPRATAIPVVIAPTPTFPPVQIGPPPGATPETRKKRSVVAPRIRPASLLGMSRSEAESIIGPASSTDVTDIGEVNCTWTFPDGSEASVFYDATSTSATAMFFTVPDSAATPNKEALLTLAGASLNDPSYTAKATKIGPRQYVGVYLRAR